MTYRERREAKAERLREWSASNEAKSTAAYDRSREIGDRIPFGQPILVGHHSEGRHRADLRRIDSAMGRSVEASAKASEQQSRANEIERQLDSSIYDDDPDAIEKLTEKIAKLEAERDRRKQANATYRKEHREELKALSPYDRHQAVPFPSWSITNLTGNIGRANERLARLTREREHGPRDRLITARFASSCETCGAPLLKGQQIRYNRQQGARCVTCPPKEGQDEG